MCACGCEHVCVSMCMCVSVCGCEHACAGECDMSACMCVSECTWVCVSVHVSVPGPRRGIDGLVS